MLSPPAGQCGQRSPGELAILRWPLCRGPKKSLFFFLQNPGHQKQIDPETFKDFYNCWKEAEAEAQEVSLPLSVTEHLDKNECVYKLSSSVKTNRGVGKIAMTQKRLFLLTEGRPGYVEISTFRNIEVSAACTACCLGAPLLPWGAGGMLLRPCLTPHVQQAGYTS